MAKPFSVHRSWSLLLLILVLAVGSACATGTGGGASGGEAPMVAPCTAQIRQANCPWQGSYAHVRRQHCAVSCTTDHESVYTTKFIDTCNDARLEDVCYTTVQNPGCQYFIDGNGRFVVTSDLGVTVGSDRNRSCANSTLSTVVLDATYRVVTMHPGTP